MKRLTQLTSFLFAALFVAMSSGISYAGNGNGQSDLCLVIRKDGTFQLNNDFLLTVQIDVPAQATLQVSEVITPYGDIVESYSTRKSKDGKVDVDIIIRGGSLNPFIAQSQQNEEVKIKVFVIEYITVDNISGVFQASGSNSAATSARITLIDHVLGSEESTNESNSIELPSENTIRVQLDNHSTSGISARTSEVALFPNPATDGFVNLQCFDGIAQGSISIHNALGSVVVQHPVSAGATTVQIPVSGLSKGVYFARVQTTTGLVVKKFNISQ